MPVFSLPGKYGIGCFSDEAKKFVDFLAEAGQHYWQILPIGPTGYGDSPYQSFSTFAGNAYFIDLENLIRQGLLTKEECEAVDLGNDPEAVDYGALFRERGKLLAKAAERSSFQSDPDFISFEKRNAFWLEDYALYMSVKAAYGGRSVLDWDDDIRLRRPEAMEACRGKFAKDILFQKFAQFEFFKEWKELKAYANSRGIEIIGDIPIYVSSDSSDFWANAEMFQVDADMKPTAVSGVPADGFSATGQLWGNPLYNWDHEKAQGYAWWIRRIGKCSELYDVIRIDHFRGFDEYFSIKAGEPNALNGHWEKGPGIELFNAVKAALPGIRIIAEDLGYVTETVKQLVRDTGFPNMKIIEFAFDSRDSSGAANYLPYNYGKNHVVYTGTHDNETLAGWLTSILPEEREMVKAYVDTDSNDDQVLVKKLIRLAVSSTADMCVIPMQDYLGLDNRARINQPSTFGTNWKWRMKEGAASPALAADIRRLCATYGRV